MTFVWTLLVALGVSMGLNAGARAQLSALPSPFPSLNLLRTATGAGYLQTVASNAPPAAALQNPYAVWLTNLSVASSNGTQDLIFTVAGGSNGLPYDVFTASALIQPLASAVWNWVGQGFPGVTYSLNSVADSSTYLLLGTPLDSDGDGLTDAYELLVSHSNPQVANSLNPAVPDGWTVLANLNPFAIYDQQAYPAAPQSRLNYWRFNNTNYASEAGQGPSLAANAPLIPDWSGTAVAITNPFFSQLVYPLIGTNGQTNFNCANGTVRFWFQPNWSTGTTNAAGGYFFDVGGSATADWSLVVINLGTNQGALMQFINISNQFRQGCSFQSGGINGLKVNFQSNHWYQLALTYSPSNVALYINAALAATCNLPPVAGGSNLYSAGNGVSYYPSSAFTTFSLGNLPGQPCAINGQLDELETFNYPLTAQQIAAGYPNFSGSTNNVMTDSDYDGRSDLLEALVDGTNPNDSLSVVPCRLGFWRFDSAALPTEEGQLPMSASAATLSSSWSGTALNLNNSPSSHVTYWDVYTNGWANINCRQGSLRFWFKPNWSNAPSVTTPLFYMGSADLSSSLWSLNVTPSGAVSFLTGSNGVITTNLTSNPLPFDSGHWSQLVLTYGPNGCALYQDGVLVASGSPVILWPNVTDRAQGLVLGNNTALNNPVNGQFDEIETFNYQLSTSSILNNFQTVQAVDQDLDGVPDLLEDEILSATRPYLPTPVVITGTVEAEQFDLGGPGVAYFSLGGNASSTYRPSGLLITNCDDLGLGYCLDQTRAGEWAQYSINVLVAQNYQIETRVEGIGTNGVFECEFTNAYGFYTNTGPLTIPSTSWTNVSAVVGLPVGPISMKLHFLGNGSDGLHVGKFNYISLYPAWEVGFTSTATNIVNSTQLSTNNDFLDASNNAAAIQQAINTLPAQGGTVLLPPGIFYVSQSSPDETKSAGYNTAVAIVANNVELAGAGKTNTFLIGYNRATTVVGVGQSGRVYAACSNIILRDLTLQSQPHRAVFNTTNTMFELGQLLSAGGYTGYLTIFYGLSPTLPACNILISNCQFLYGDCCIGLVYYVNNCLVTHCDLNIWGGTNVYLYQVNPFPFNTAHTSKYNGSVGIFGSGGPDYNILIVENTYNGYTNVVTSTNSPSFAPDGMIYFQSGGNFFVARNIISNYSLEALQFNSGPCAMVGNCFGTFLNGESTCAIAPNRGVFPGLPDQSALDYSYCVIGNSVVGGRVGSSAQDENGIASSLNISGNWMSLYPPPPSSFPGALLSEGNFSWINLCGNTLAAGGYGAVFSDGCGSALVANNNFSGATYRSVGLAQSETSPPRALFFNNIFSTGSTFHLQVPVANSFGWFLYKNTYLNAAGVAEPPFMDPASSAIHYSP